jgi:uncharacterized repeat protein (TIGR01451 family)
MNERAPLGKLYLVISVIVAVVMIRVVTSVAAPSPEILAPTSRYVATGGSDGTNDCTILGSPCATLQHAIDAAGAGDEIRVAAGTYTTVTNRGSLSQIGYVTRSLTLRGGYDAGFTTWDPETYTSTLDSGGAGRGLYISGSIAVTVTGFTIQNNSADGLGGSRIGDDAGGGIYVVGATAIISGNVFRQNTGSSSGDGYGGGIHLLDSDSHVLNNALRQNDATTYSGWSSTSGSGGGLCAEGGAPWVAGNTVVDNQTSPGGLFAGGGGLGFHESTPTMVANVVRGNRAAGDGLGLGGGGVELLACAPFTLTNNVIAGNTGAEYGVGVYVGAVSGQPSSGQLLHNTLVSNREGPSAEALYVDAGEGGTRSTVTAINTLIVDHDTGVAVGGSTNATVTVHLTRTLWGEGTWANDVNWIVYTDNAPTHTLTSALAITGTPDFNSPTAGDYHIGRNSDAWDAGVDAGVMMDVDGEARDATPDIGADELGAHVLQITKAAGAGTVYPGDLVPYTVTVSSSGAMSITGVIVTDTLPSAMRPLATGSVSATCALVDAGYGGRVRCDVGDLSGGQEAVITLTAQVTTTEPAGSPQTLRNTAQAVGDQASNVATADVTWLATSNCHARVNGALPDHHTVQAAVDAGAPGDVIWIAGTCLGTQGAAQQALLTQTLTLRGGYNDDFSAWDPEAYTTTLDAEGEGRVLLITDTARVTVTHLTLTGGDAVGLGGSVNGDAGGGMLVVSATATLSHCRVVSNVASSLFSGAGGGIAALTSTLRLLDTRVTDNLGATDFFGLGEGGGLYAQAATVEMRDSRFEGNVGSAGIAGTGGGAWLSDTTLDARSTLWLSNTVSSLLDWGVGGGLYVAGRRPFTLTNGVFLGNRAQNDTYPPGSALFLDGASGVLRHPTLAGNAGGSAISAYYTTSLTLTNAIIYSQTVGIHAAEQSVVTVDGVLWHRVTTPTQAVTATVAVSHTLTGDPAFTADGYHLTPASAAVDAGVAPGVDRDVDGEARTQSTMVDLGADELGNRPRADAGADQRVEPDPAVTLDGSGSDDPDGDDLTFGWAQTGGSPTLTLDDPSAISPTLTATDVGVFTFTLTVTNTTGLQADDMVIVTVGHTVYLPLVIQE